MSLPLAVLFGVLMGCATLVAICIFASLLTWMLCEVWEAAARAQAATDFSLLLRQLRAYFQREREEQGMSEVPRVFFVCLCRSPLREPEYFCAIKSGEPQFSKDKTAALKFANIDTHVLRAVTLRIEQDGDTVFVCFEKGFCAAYG